MSKKLNVDAIRSELSEGSAFFPSYKKQDSPIEPTPLPQLDNEQTRTPSTPVPPVRVGRDVRDVPSTLPKKRVMKQRHPFDIYHDQYESLQALSLEERKQGGIGSMSAMVREAIDKFIAERKKPTR